VVEVALDLDRKTKPLLQHENPIADISNKKGMDSEKLPKESWISNN
jgi:hypothetical protein